MKLTTANLGWLVCAPTAGLFEKISVAIMFGIELAAPFLILCGRRPRQIACGAFALLMLLISLTGNYCFFNLLTLALCVLPAGTTRSFAIATLPQWLRL